MPEASRSIFNERASDKLRSPDDLDKYVQVTNPSVWVILVACIALLAGLLAWGVFGSVTTNVSATGVIANGQATCFLSADNVAKVSVGDSARACEGRLGLQSHFRRRHFGSDREHPAHREHHDRTHCAHQLDFGGQCVNARQDSKSTSGDADGGARMRCRLPHHDLGLLQ